MMRRISPRIGKAASLLLSLWALSLTQVAQAATPSRVATDVKVSADERGMTSIAVSFSEAPTYSARLERNGSRLIVDVPNTAVKGAPTALTKKVGLVGGLMIQAFNTGKQSTTRLLITLLKR